MQLCALDDPAAEWQNHRPELLCLLSCVPHPGELSAHIGVHVDNQGIVQRHLLPEDRATARNGGRPPVEQWKRRRRGGSDKPAIRLAFECRTKRAIGEESEALAESHRRRGSPYALAGCGHVQPPSQCKGVGACQRPVRGFRFRESPGNRPRRVGDTGAEKPGEFGPRVGEFAVCARHLGHILRSECLLAIERQRGDIAGGSQGPCRSCRRSGCGGDGLVQLEELLRVLDGAVRALHLDHDVEHIVGDPALHTRQFGGGDSASQRNLQSAHERKPDAAVRHRDAALRIAVHVVEHRIWPGTGLPQLGLCDANLGQRRLHTRVACNRQADRGLDVERSFGNRVPGANARVADRPGRLNTGTTGHQRGHSVRSAVHGGWHASRARHDGDNGGTSKRRRQREGHEGFSAEI